MTATVRWSIISIALAGFLFSCGIYRLSKRDLSWQPYRVNDKLVFESSEGETDSLRIRSIEKYNNPDDPLALFPNSVQTLFVAAHKNVLRLSAETSGKYIEFSLHLGEKFRRYPCLILSLNRKGIEREEMVTVNSKKAFKIMAKESCDNMKDKPHDLLFVYWSKEFGYLSFEFKNGYNWRLTQFIRDGKNIL